jgi:hypothetical protein
LDKFDENQILSNRMYRPYRDEIANNSDDDEDNCSVTTTTSTIIDPQIVRSKVTKALQKRIKTERRRIRNKGETAMVTAQKREVSDAIKQRFF